MQILNKEDVERAKSGNENVQELIDTEKNESTIISDGAHCHWRICI